MFPSQKGRKIYSILNFKCPHCQEGAFFLSHPYDLRNMGRLHKECPACHRKYSKEPGFYYGGMYVSYALSVALSLVAYGLFWWLVPQLGFAWHFGLSVVVLLLATPYMYALSKIIWANLFFSYQGGTIGRGAP